VDNVEEVATTISKEVQETQKLIQLAAAQRMNTDLRRAIFCIIMSGEDYIDTFEKILKLDLSGKQVTVLLILFICFWFDFTILLHLSFSLQLHPSFYFDKTTG